MVLPSCRGVFKPDNMKKVCFSDTDQNCFSATVMLLLSVKYEYEDPEEIVITSSLLLKYILISLPQRPMSGFGHNSQALFVNLIIPWIIFNQSILGPVCKSMQLRPIWYLFERISGNNNAEVIKLNSSWLSIKDN